MIAPMNIKIPGIHHVTASASDSPHRVALPVFSRGGCLALQSALTRASVRRRHHPDLRHHAPVLVFEDVAVIDELT